MYAVNAIYDGEKLKFNEPIPGASCKPANLRFVLVLQKPKISNKNLESKRELID